MKAFTVHPRAICTGVDDEENPGRRIAPDGNVLPGDLVGCVQCQFHGLLIASATDADFVLSDGEGLRTGIVLVPNVCKYGVGCGLPVCTAGAALCCCGRLAAYERRF